MARTPHMRASLLICKCTGLFSLDTMSHRGALRPVHLAQRKGYIPRLATPPPPLPSPIPAATPAPDNHHSILCLCELDCFRYFTLERSELRHWAEIIMDQQSQVCNALCHSVSPPNNTERWAWWPRRGLHDGPRPQPNEWWRQDWSPGSSNAQRLVTAPRSQQEWEGKTRNVLVAFLPCRFSYRRILGCLSASTWENVWPSTWVRPVTHCTNLRRDLIPYLPSSCPEQVVLGHVVVTFRGV